jgi:hypothetical protein
LVSRQAGLDLFFRKITAFQVALARIGTGVDRERAIKERLMAWMRGAGNPWASFEQAAMELFEFQFERNVPYRRFCESLGKTPKDLGSWLEIPALPTDAFKFPTFRPRSFSEKRVTRRFLTSGTTKDVRGVHEFPDFDLYRTSIKESWRTLNLPEIADAWFLSQSPSVAPESSLVAMFEVLGDGSSDRWLIDESGKFQLSAFRERARGEQPVCLFSTALALLRLIETEEPIVLPTGSWIFETGGYKGLTETLEPEIFRQKVGTFFGISPGKILNEYSMTELSSQFYRWPDDAGHRGPEWTRIRVIDPETGRVAKDGEAGYLEILDLANLGSVLAIRTQDLAISQGPAEFLLLGRDPGALPRGCSRAADDLLKNR